MFADIRKDLQRHGRPGSLSSDDEEAFPILCTPAKQIEHVSVRLPSRLPQFRRSKRSKTHPSAPTPLTRDVVPSPAAVVARQMVEAYQRHSTFLNRTRLEQIIPRLNASPALMYAARAAVKASQLHFRPLAGPRAHPGLKDYIDAVTAIRSNLSASEPVLLAINLLCYSDLITGSDVLVLKHHGRGLQSLLLADDEKWARNAVGRSVLFGTRLLAVEASIAAGMPSPFEHDRWLQHDIPSARPSYATILSRLAHQIFFKLPRLATYLCKIRAGDTGFTMLCETAGLAQRILRIRDDHAFHAMLVNCEVRQTVSDADRVLVPSSLYFADLDEFDDFLDYCRARLTIITLCLTLPQLIPKYIVPQSDQLQKEQLVACDAVLRCWQNCMETQRFAKSMASAFFPMYGALRQMESWRGVAVDKVISWLEYKSMIALGHVKGFRGEADLASTWDMYCGGPPEKSIYRQWV